MSSPLSPGLPDADAAPRAPRLLLPRERPPTEAGRRLRLGLAVGAFAAAGTIGALIGFGLRERATLRPFTAIGRQALALDAAHTGLARIAATATGLVLHVTIVSVWAIAFALVSARWTGWRRWLAAGVTGSLAYLADRTVMPELLRLVDVPGVLPPQRAAVYVVFSLALAIGMRVALSMSRPD